MTEKILTPTAQAVAAWRGRIEAAGYYIDEFAAKIGKHQAHVSRWLNGKDVPNDDNFSAGEAAVRWMEAHPKPKQPRKRARQ